MNALETSLYNALKAGTALISLLGGTRIYNTYAPRRSSLPYVIFHQQAGREDNLTPRRTARWWYTVKAVAATMLEAGPIAAEIDTLLHDKEDLAVTGWATAWWVSRDTTIRYIESKEDTDPIAHAGAVYEIRLCKE